MAVIEVVTFRLAPGVDAHTFVRADAALQAEFAYRQHGLLRRTTARGTGGEWLVVSVWESDADADASADAATGDPDATRFSSFLDGPSLTTRRYETLD
jgi:heme-degrading monooxygenase HmoA